LDGKSGAGGHPAARAGYPLSIQPNSPLMELSRRHAIGGGLAVLASACAPSGGLKIGFLVKMPEQPWFITEQEAAIAAGRTRGFEVLRFGTPDGEKLVTAIDTLAAVGARGFVVCAPDVRLGPAIRYRAERYAMKAVSVDDQLLNADGVPLDDIPHLGMSGRRIGEQVGEALAAELDRRGWAHETVGALRLTFDELPTAKERTDGATSALLKSGFPSANIIDAPQRSTDTEGGFNAALPVLGRETRFKRWVIFAVNDDTVVGAVRAVEQLRFSPADAIGIGINGSGPAIAEFQKRSATAFQGSIALPTAFHGSQSALNLVEWIRTGRRPPANTVTTGVLMTRANWREISARLAG